MVAIVTVKIKNESAGTTFTKEVHFNVGDIPKSKWQGVKPENIEEVYLDGEELKYAKEFLGAPKINEAKTSFTFFGDMARQIYFNW